MLELRAGDLGDIVLEVLLGFFIDQDVERSELTNGVLTTCWQPMAIGVDNNDIVGPSRRGPRNQRRSPLVANTIFYPALMWTPRFIALSGDPFDPSRGFKFPPPENIVTGEPTLLAAQGSLPSTELVEMAGFTGITANPGPFGPRHFQFDDGHGQALPAPDATGFHNFPLQAAVDARLNAIPEYRKSSGWSSTAAPRCHPVASRSACAVAQSPSSRPR